MSVKVKFARLRENAKIPVRRSCDAGYDIYACFDEQEMRLEPNETKLVPTGIASAFDEGRCFVLKERGSTGIRGFGQRAGVMDSGFRGEWHVALTNHNDVPLIISKDGAEREDAVVYPYEKAICQALLLPVPNVEISEISPQELASIPSERGDGMLGSSGK